jgi:hypothetical protein
MSIRRVNCPGCDLAVNVPAAMANVKCPSCATVWNVNNPAAAQKSAEAKKAAAEPAAKSDEKNNTANAAMIAGLVGGVMMLFAILGLGLILLNRQPPPAPVAEAEETIKPAIPEKYRVINLPEEHRKRIYKDYRTVARTTVEKPLILPQGTKVRQSLENMLQKTFDRELLAFSALHDITVDDVQEVIKEGDAKVWDGSPRSNAVRDGKRVYTEEMSEGWGKNPNRI